MKCVIGLLACLCSLASNAESLPTQAGIKQFVQRVLEENPRVRAANASQRAASAFGEAADRPAYNPALSAGIESSDGNARTVTLSQTLDWRGKREAKTSVALAELDVANWQRVLVRQAVAGELVSALAEWSAAVALDRLAARKLEIIDQFDELAGRRLRAGDLSGVERDFAALSLANARIDRAATAVALEEAAQKVIRVAPGVQRSEWPSITGLPPQIDDNVDTSLVEIPLVARMRGELLAAQARVRETKRARQADPTVSLTGGRESGQSLVGLTVSIPLNVLNNYNGEVDAAQARAVVAARRFDDAVIAATTDLAAIRTRYEALRDAWTTWLGSGQPSLDRQVETLRNLWASGDMSTTDYLVQAEKTIDVRARARRLEQSTWQAWSQWLVTSGSMENWINEGKQNEN
ncbi:MAG: TolC family protein [Pseudomonadales bacterium]|nr:TolC family protein [Pseudomonadales bacterium]